MVSSSRESPSSQFRKHYLHKEEEEAKEEEEPVEDTEEDKEVSRSLGAHGAKAEHTIQTIAGARTERTTSVHEKTKLQPLAATTVEKKDTSKPTALTERREMRYAIALETLNTEKMVQTKKAVQMQQTLQMESRLKTIHNDSRVQPASAWR